MTPGAISWQIHWYDEVSSTNDVAAQFAERGARGRLRRRRRGAVRGARPARARVVVAGWRRALRLGRAPPRADVTCRLVTIAAGVALAEGIQAASGLDASVKWPNDLLRSAGESSPACSRRRDHRRAAFRTSCSGFGVNVRPAAFPPDVASRATSIEGELGRAIDRGLLLAACLGSLASRYADLRDGRAAAVLDAWRLRAASTLRRRGRVGSGTGAGSRGGGEYRRRRRAAGSRRRRRRAGDLGEVRWI